MSVSWSGKFDQVKARIKDAVGTADGDVDADTVVHRIREAVAQAGADVDTEALKTRVKDVVGKAEGTVDSEKLKQWIDDLDRDKLKSWLDNAKTMTTGAAAAVETQGERLAEQAPGAVDTLLGTVKEKIGGLTGNQDLAHEGELDNLRGDIKERFASAQEQVTKAADDTTATNEKKP